MKSVGKMIAEKNNNTPLRLPSQAWWHRYNPSAGEVEILGALGPVRDPVAEAPRGGQRDGPAVKRACCFCRGP